MAAHFELNNRRESKDEWRTAPHHRIHVSIDTRAYLLICSARLDVNVFIYLWRLRVMRKLFVSVPVYIEQLFSHGF